ncbi:hypothetical protein [Clostridium sp. BJN0013]|uniref:hypothetical protein n=1 Tax=Clostridium sp. BJN0013 TaxID=3236840 RepID=UPI0034C61050
MDKVKNNEQVKALVDFLEYLFLIEEPELGNKYEKFKKSQGGVFILGYGIFLSK